MTGKSVLLLGLCAQLALPAFADGSAIDRVLDEHVLPGYRGFAQESAVLAGTAAKQCSSTDAGLRESFHSSFDAWIRVSHLRFGPSEVEDRAFALAFWPDTKGKTPKALRNLILNSDPVVESREEFRQVSIAGRGFHALEFMLYDPEFAELGEPDYRCALIRAITADIAESAAAILADWEGGHADLMRTAGSNDTYQSQQEALKRIFTALTTGLQFTSEARLGRPLGTFERPRPKRSEARRSGRSLNHVILSLESARDLSALLSDRTPELDAALSAALIQAGQIDDPIFAGVSDPRGRFEVEALQQSIDHVRQILTDETGPRLGLAAGFNLLDGD